MSAKNNQHFDIDALDYHLGSMGFLYPVNDIQMKGFDILFKDFDYKLKNAQIDCSSIIEGHVRQGKVHRLDSVDEDDDNDGYKDIFEEFGVVDENGNLLKVGTNPKSW